MTASNPPETVPAQLRAFEEHYDYDTSYLRELWRLAPEAHARFASAQSMAQRNAALAQDAHAVACIAVMVSDDCGACAQLQLRMAVEIGVDRAVLQTLLDEPEALPAPLADIYAHAQQITQGIDADIPRAARLRQELGDTAFGELAVTITGARIYPTLKRALATTTHCRKPTLDF